uniref:Intracellular hyaluronan-binding protein 4 N-terminal domain-containing protein n=1 Tax=Balaenoptera musculus TaxID=9771 RepID=A0A8C0DN36_BALMU
VPGHLQEGFVWVVTNRSDQLFDEESDPLEVLKAAENKKKEAGGGGVGGPGTKSAAQAAAQTSSNMAGKQLRKESQKDRKNPLPPSVGVVDKKEEMQPPVALKKEGIRRLGRRSDQQLQGRFEKPPEEKGEGGEFSVDRLIIDWPIRDPGRPGRGGRGGRGGHGRGGHPNHGIRTDKSSASPPDVDDPEAFPALA